MAISRAQLAKELEPGLNALFGLEYDRYDNEHAEIFDEETSDRAFEEEVMLGGFGTAPVKSEGGTISFDDAQETFTARYTHETIALAFSISEEAIEDNEEVDDEREPREGRLAHRVEGARPAGCRGRLREQVQREYACRA